MTMHLTSSGDSLRRLKCWIGLLLILMPVKSALSQAQYIGVLGTQPIHLFVQAYGDGVVHAVYMYDKYGSPIVVNGRLNGSVLELREENKLKQITAILKFDHFELKSKEAKGDWIAKDRQQHFPINLIREFSVEDGEQVEAPPVEIIQAGATKDHYFKTVVVKKKGDFYPRVAGVKVLKKGQDSVLQRISLDAEYRGAYNVFVDDYNFDGIEDFSVFESSYAGPNTSSIYFLRKRKSGLYFRSSFSGTSLEFDSSSKLIHEHNQCCGGRLGMNATYKVVNDKMKLVEKECYELDSETGDMKIASCE